MSVMIEEDGKNLILKISGHLNWQQQKHFHRVYDKVANFDKFILDVNDVDFIDSTGISLILGLKSTIQRAGRGDVIIINCKPSIYDLLKISKIDQLLKIET